MSTTLRTILKSHLDGPARAAALPAIYPAWRHWSERINADPSAISAAPVEIAAEYVAACTDHDTLVKIAAKDTRRAVLNALTANPATAQTIGAAPVVARSARLRGLLARPVADVAAEFKADKLTATMAWQWLQAIDPTDRPVAYRGVPDLGKCAGQDDVTLRAQMLVAVAAGEVAGVTTREIANTCTAKQTHVAHTLAETFSGAVTPEIYRTLQALGATGHRSIALLADRVLAGLATVSPELVEFLGAVKHESNMMFVHAAGRLDERTAAVMALVPQMQMGSLLAAVPTPVAEVLVRRVINETSYYVYNGAQIRSVLTSHPSMSSATKALVVGRLEPGGVAAAFARSDPSLPLLHPDEYEPVLASLVAGAPRRLVDMCSHLAALQGFDVMGVLVRDCATMAGPALGKLLGDDVDRAVADTLVGVLGTSQAAWECLVSIAAGWNASVGELAATALLLADLHDDAVA